nr:ATP-binding cassette transporter Abca3-like1 [Brachionus angularis]
MWKNFIIFRRNLIGTFLEILCPYIFVSFLIIIRYFIERIRFKNFFNIPKSVLELSPLTIDQKRNLILFYPNNNLIKSFVTNAAQILSSNNPNFFPIVFGVNVSSGFDLDSSIIPKMAVFYSFPSNYTKLLPDKVEYTIYTQEDSVNRFKIDSILPTRNDYLYNRAPEDFCHDPSFFSLYNSFNAFKFSLDTQLISNLTQSKIYNNNLLKLTQFDCPDYEQDELESTFAFFPPLLISIAFIFTSVFTIGNIVAEKSSKMKEYLKLVGIRWYTIYISWWIRNVIIFFILSVVISIVCKIYLSPNSSNPLLLSRAVLTNTNFLVIFVFLLIYSIQSVSFTLLVSQLFSTPFNAKVVLLVIWIMTAINFYDDLPTSVLKYLFCFFPNLGLIFGFQVLYQFERSTRVFNIAQLYENLYSDPLNLGSIMATMLLWSVLYFPLTWYFENILPGDYGLPLPFYFPFTRNYWFPQKLLKEQKHFITSKNGPSFEQDPKNSKRTVTLTNLSKTFKTFRSVKTAVKNISINFYENQITGLLGHNGAGKTTTTFMLCGLYPPTSGNANLMGFDLRNQMDEIRSILGYCPQVDILFDNFNVEEHLKLIAMGFPKNKLNDEINRIATFVGLQKDLSKRSKNLSGGMKRRLMVAMALIGDSKIIILDEPTSGLDPFNRVKLWELIRRYKNNHTIILTTHFMEEADALSDRIAIMNHGEIKCCGSPIFLKNYYGNGFRIKIVKNKYFNTVEFENLLKEHLSDYKIEINVAAEFCLSFPFDKVKQMPIFLNELESKKIKLGFDSFLNSNKFIIIYLKRVGKIDQYDQGDNSTDLINVDESAFNAFKEKIEFKKGKDLWLQQIKTLLYKRLIVFTRRYILAAVILAIPFVFQLILVCIIPSSSSVIDRLGKTVNNYGIFKLDINRYGSQEIPYYISNPNPDLPLNKLFKSFYSYSNRPQINLIRTYSSSINELVFRKHNSSLKSLLNEYYFAMSWFNSGSNVNNFEIIASFSKMAFQSPGVIVNEISNLLLSYLDSNKLDKTISTINAPMPPDNSNYFGNNFLKYLGCFDILPLSLFNFATSIVIAFMISINIMHVSKEKINGSKKLQLLSNTNSLIYWSSNFIFDFIICLINICLILGITCLVSAIRNNPEIDISIISSRPTIGYMFLILIISSFNWTLIAYSWLHFFKSDVTAFVILLLLLGVVSFTDIVLSFVQIFINITNPDVDFDSPGTLIMYSLRMILCILFPNIFLFKANFQYDTFYLDIAEPGNGLFILISVFQLVLITLIFIGIETNALNKEFLKNIFSNLIKKKFKYISMNESIEDDVQKEIYRIKNSNLNLLSSNEPLIVNNLLKLFRKKNVNVSAVDNLCFGVKSHTCFGLLGMNGAGKSTTFKIITGELEPNKGDVLVNGFSIQAKNSLARQNLGYCPQFDRLIEFLTVKETLNLFALLRGIDAELALKLSKDMLDIFQLNEFKNTYVQNLSGGNKRKVSCAIAFIGKPSVVILDEPSTGIYSGARKFLWNIIKKARDLGMTIVLSSHSMEECEALCDKLGILLNGQLQCLGTIPDIKNKYGNGYRLLIKCNHSEQLENVILNLDNFIKLNFPSAYLEDRQYETLFYIIKSGYGENEQNLSKMFSIIEENKDFLNIESYYLSQTTLEQVFMSFANKSLSLISSINKTVLNKNISFNNDLDSLENNLYNNKKKKKYNKNKISLLSYKQFHNLNSNDSIPYLF